MTQRKKFKRPDGTLNPPQGYDELADEFVRLRDEYFPDWTDGANWKVMPYDGTACCDRENRTIKIRPDRCWSVAVLIIHAIVHAVTVDDHGPRWQRRLRKAAKRAKKIGQHELFQELDMQLAILSLPEAYDVQPDEVYYELEMTVRDQASRVRASGRTLRHESCLATHPHCRSSRC